jgi:hypothetical protein
MSLVSYTLVLKCGACGHERTAAAICHTEVVTEARVLDPRSREASRSHAGPRTVSDSPSPGEGREAQHRSSAEDQAAPSTVDAATTDYALIHDRLAKLAALADHNYCAYRESRSLLERRDRELADLRQKLECVPAPIRASKG